MKTVRIVVQTADGGMAANVGGPVFTHTKTFDVVAPELAKYLSEKMSSFSGRTVLGVEVLPDPSPTAAQAQ